ncbi:uncharacterized protein LOC143910069 [Arctopsyche grandis]|uniref:uncharacterized protein LOC143910069 n=1 Tax=Arctopsyche grandis TaxID=121162 RepID=UPI00406D7CA6
MHQLKKQHKQTTDHLSTVKNTTGLVIGPTSTFRCVIDHQMTCVRLGHCESCPEDHLRPSNVCECDCSAVNSYTRLDSNPFQSTPLYSTPLYAARLRSTPTPSARCRLRVRVQAGRQASGSRHQTTGHQTPDTRHQTSDTRWKVTFQNMSCIMFFFFHEDNCNRKNSER